jgi:hypothetical protein
VLFVNRISIQHFILGDQAARAFAAPQSGSAPIATPASRVGN